MDLSIHNKYLNVTTSFHLIGSKNLPGEFYAKAAPGF